MCHQARETLLAKTPVETRNRKCQGSAESLEDNEVWQPGFREGRRSEWPQNTGHGRKGLQNVLALHVAEENPRIGVCLGSHEEHKQSMHQGFTGWAWAGA